VSVPRLLSGKIAPMRGARYQLPSCACAVETAPPTIATAIRALKALCFIICRFLIFVRSRSRHGATPTSCTLLTTGLSYLQMPRKEHDINNYFDLPGLR